MKPATVETVLEVFVTVPRAHAYWLLNRDWAQELKANLYHQRHGDKCLAPSVASTDQLLGLPIVLTDLPIDPRLVIDNAGYL